MAKKAKGKRRRRKDYLSGQAPPAGFVLPASLSNIVSQNDKIDKARFEAFLSQLVLWMSDVGVWGQDLRDDLLRVEGAVGFAGGDPGDPPEGPFD